MSLLVHTYTSQARLWVCRRGDVSTSSIGSHLNPISTRGGRLCPPYAGVHTKLWKPQARLDSLKEVVWQCHCLDTVSICTYGWVHEWQCHCVNLYSKTFYLKKCQKDKSSLCVFLRNNNHLNNPLSSPRTFYLIKSMNFNDVSESDETFSSQSCHYTWLNGKKWR